MLKKNFFAYGGQGQYPQDLIRTRPGISIRFVEEKSSRRNRLLRASVTVPHPLADKGALHSYLHCFLSVAHSQSAHDLTSINPDVIRDVTISDSDMAVTDIATVVGISLFAGVLSEGTILFHSYGL